VAAVHGQPFVLRAESPPATLGGGRVLQPSARRYRRRDQAAIERLGQLRSTEPRDRIRAALAFLGLAPWTETRLAALVGLPPESLRAALAALAASEGLIELPVGPRRTVRVLGETVADLEDRVVRAIGRLHAARPRQTAIPRAHLAAELPDLANEALLSGVLERLKRQNRVIADARTIALPGHQAKLSQGERRLKQELAESIRAGGISPPEAAELAAAAGPRAAAVPDLLALLRDEQQIVEINPGLYLDVDVAADLRRKVRERLADGATMTMADLRDLLGTTRKYAVPIGEYLDRIGLTRREGDLRRLGDADANVEPPAAIPS
jgi:selenocysteine-specific elongation factor